MRAPLVAAGIAAGAVGLLAYASRSAESQLFGHTLVAPPHPDQLALTFDDGPNPAATGRLLEVLARHNVSATFFLIGRFVLSEPGLTREIAAAGHVLGNHTMTHPFLPRLRSARIHGEIAACNRALEDTVGRPIALFRPPYGARRPAVLRIARSLGLKTVQWNLIAGDWNPLAAETLLNRLERGIARCRRRSRGTTICLHDGGHRALGEPRLPTVQAVDLLLTRLARLDPDTRFVTPTDWD